MNTFGQIMQKLKRLLAGERYRQFVDLGMDGCAVEYDVRWYTRHAEGRRQIKALEDIRP